MNCPSQFLGLLVLFHFSSGDSDKGSCPITNNRAGCVLNIGSIPVKAMANVNNCHQPVDVTFIVKVQEPALEWRHTFVPSNVAERQLVVGFPDKLLLCVNVSNVDAHQGLLRADFHTAREDLVPFINSIVHLKQSTNCKQLVSSYVSHIVAGVMMPVLLVVLATGGFLLYCKCRKSTMDQLTLVENVAGIPGASPYQEGSPRVQFNKQELNENELIIENSFATTRSESEA